MIETVYTVTVVLILCFILQATASDAGELGDRASVAEISCGELKAVFRDNSQSPDILSGLASLFNTKYAPDFDAYDPDSTGASAGMNFEHIISGHADPHNAFAPRHGTYTLYKLPDGKSVMWQRRAEDDPWKMESTTKVTMTEPYYLDMDFRCKPTDAARFGSRGYAIFFWCNYMNNVAEVPLHFLGIDKEGGEEKWMAGDASVETKDWDTGGTYRNALAHDLAYDKGHNFKLNSWSYDYPRYTKPFYYGLTEHGMVYVLMFDHSYTPEDEIRFSIFKFKLKNHPRPAWDYEYVIHKVEAGKEYGYKARVVYKKFISPEDCLKEYEDWARSLED